MKPDLLELALSDAAKSLETIVTAAGKDDYLESIVQIRQYANNRAVVARAALEAANLEAQPEIPPSPCFSTEKDLRKARNWVLQSIAAQPVGVPAGMELVPLEFVQGFNTLAHNYSLQAIAPDYYHGVERDAFKNAYARCGQDLAKLRAMLSAAPAIPVEPVHKAFCNNCEQLVSGPCSSADCSISDSPASTVELPVVAWMHPKWKDQVSHVRWSSDCLPLILLSDAQAAIAAQGKS